ncbi:lamin tail domain-containing protein [Streptomyces sp. Edi4]|uniref:lamin tail domain-containing protein n=1 Tax=Streptomyces sp. Edi4 TaxID=3162527 RepID=UPI0033064AEF
MSPRSISRVAALTLAAAGLAATAVVPATAAARPTPHSPVVLGAIQYDSPGRDDRSQKSLNAEWVTVTNTGRGAVNLRGWTLTERRSHLTYTFRDLRLGGHQSVRVHTGRGHNTGRDVYQGRRDYMWDNNTDSAVLRDAHKRTVDVKSWRHR